MSASDSRTPTSRTASNTTAPNTTAPNTMAPNTMAEWLSPWLPEGCRSGMAPYWNQPLPHLVVDSRALKAGEGFLSMPTLMAKRVEYVLAALNQGAQWVLVDQSVQAQLSEHPLSQHKSLTERCLFVPQLDQHLGEVISQYFGHPSRDMQLIGITGTNGKSSTAFFCAQLLNALGVRAGVIGTLGYGPLDQLTTGLHTTPDAFRLHQELANMRDQHIQVVAMEVSSHSLEQNRLVGIEFNTAVITNLSRDHLDYHGSLEAYGAAKAKLFAWPNLKRAIINQDDAFARSLAERLSLESRSEQAGPTQTASTQTGSTQTAIELVRYGLKDQPPAQNQSMQHLSMQHLSMQQWQSNPEGLAGQMHSPWGVLDMRVPLIGAFNLSNLMAAIAAVAPWVPSRSALQQALAAIKAVPGRMEWLVPAKHQPSAPNVVIDYAHTPDALAQALTAIKPHVAGRLHLVFGCGGDRDQGKRAEMGRIAETLADCVWVTSDNPRSEPPERIIEAIMAEVHNRHHWVSEVDRGKAIAKAICEASAEDWVLIAGKGHETYQEIKGQRTAFSDRTQALALIGEML